MGRKPTDDDLIVPFAEPGEFFGQHIDNQMMLRRFHGDLETLGMRPRRQHDARRTFISLCLGDGARWDILRWITHARPKSTSIDDYTTLIWNPLCEEIAKLRVSIRRSQAPAVASPNSAETLSAESLRVTPKVTPLSDDSEFLAGHAAIDPMYQSARRGTRTPTSFETRT
jgi:hypothetical protein